MCSLVQCDLGCKVHDSESVDRSSWTCITSIPCEVEVSAALVDSKRLFDTYVTNWECVCYVV